MQFRFDGNQEYQLRAIESAADLFKGQPRVETELTFAENGGFPAVANRLDLDEATVLGNLKTVQERNGLKQDGSLDCIEQSIETASGTKAVRFPNFTVEMETGTGKTYIYLRTALELFRRYGLRKFIIVVPSIAIREGVLKTLDVTKTHLGELYQNTPYRYYAYDSASLTLVRQFALSDSIELMVMTIDSFNKASNVIRQSTDRLQGETPIHLVQTARPILILDEPQNMESELRVKALSALDPLFALRYSATHRNPYNVIYRLTPIEAYRQGLVKRIEVAGIESEADANQVFLRLDGVKAEKQTLTARIAVHKLMTGGQVKEQIVTVKSGDKLDEKANRPEYAAFSIEEIDAGEQLVRFSNGTVLRVGESRGANREAVFEAQIRYTLEEHLRKQAKLKEADIKVLSLFFIDRVDNYVREDGIIRTLFLKVFNEQKEKTAEWKDLAPAKLQAAYFAKRRTREGQTVYEDSKTGESEKDREVYDLIMRDKERLLSFEEPTCFIFSHSALREGWDSPNIFQICTLNQTASEIKKRQEIGRGVRLAVNQSGERIRDEQVNVLTVVANQSYEDYVARYQTEIEEEFGKEGLPPKPPDARNSGVAKLRKAYTLKPEFKALWNKIKRKTRYAVKINREKLVADVVSDLDKEGIEAPRLLVAKGRLEAVAGSDIFSTKIVAEGRKSFAAEPFQLPNLVELMQSLMERTTPPMRLTRRTLLEVFRRTKNNKAALDNPHGFATVAVRIIKEKLADQLVSGIQYHKINEWYEMSQFEPEIRTWREYLVKADHSVYDHVIYESDTEKEFVLGLEKRLDVLLYLKLPGWFTVMTPVGEYNPDWAIVLEQRDEHGIIKGKPVLYLVRETKSPDWKTDSRPDELRKIRCGEEHFKGALGVDYKVISSAKELP